MAFVLVVRLGVFFVGFLGLLALSQVVYMVLSSSGKSSRYSVVRLQNLRLVSVILVMLMGFALLQVSYVNRIFFGSQDMAIDYFRTHLQWVADYIMGSPVFYYFLVIFKGSPLVEVLAYVTLREG